MIGNISTNGLTPVLLAKKMKVDYGKDVQIVARLADVPVFFLATTTNFPPKTFPEFIAYAKAHPGKVRYGSAGVGSYQQINTEMLAKRAGIELLHIPFKDGGAQIIRDLGNGDIQVSWFNITNPVGMMKAGRVRPLAISADARLPQYPDVPTMAEVGFPGVKADPMGGGFRAVGDAVGDHRDAARGIRQGGAHRRRCRRRFNAAAWWRRRQARSPTRKPGCATKWRPGSGISTTSASSWTSDPGALVERGDGR